MNTGTSNIKIKNQEQTNPSFFTKFQFQVYLSSIVGLFALGIIAFDNGNDTLIKWAIGIIAFLLGYAEPAPFHRAYGSPRHHYVVCRLTCSDK